MRTCWRLEGSNLGPLRLCSSSQTQTVEKKGETDRGQAFLAILPLFPPLNSPQFSSSSISNLIAERRRKWGRKTVRETSRRLTSNGLSVYLFQKTPWLTSSILLKGRRLSLEETSLEQVALSRVEAVQRICHCKVLAQLIRSAADSNSKTPFTDDSWSVGSPALKLIG